ncbi:hypothetical protein RhiirC2_768787 [Rhizophagus irregularis]|uniref:Uncharacterized protein n=2 Tax=Rhizophagus irregularis TaxID=588596 RepID=A0A2N1P0Z6_9GLOM|nr:hypothetical protein RhiirC2_768787 [Rhizophagus irregularis]
MVMLEDFKKLCEYLTFPDGHIAIGRTQGGSGNSCGYVILHMSISSNVWSVKLMHAPSAVFVAQQPFSSYTFPKMKALFGLKADDYNELPTFVGGEKETPEEIRNLVIGEFLRLHKTSQHITSANEATCCEFISRVIYGAASIYGGFISSMKSPEVMAKALYKGRKYHHHSH